MAKQKGHRANKPQDNKGTVDNPNLYRNKYREDVYKDEEETENVEATEEKSDPVQETATQNIGESFVEVKKDHDYKKRYDDLKNHYDKKLAEWKTQEAKLQNAWKTAESTSKDIRIPQNVAEMKDLKDENPELYNVIEELSNAKVKTKLTDIQSELDQYKGKSVQLQREKAYEELLRLQPNFDKLKSEDKFLRWLETQPKSIADGIYNNSTDAKWASRVIDLYKADTGKPSRSIPKQEDAAASVNAPQTRDVRTTDGKGNRIWKASEIERMKPWEFEKVEAEIDKARSEGRIDLSS